METQAAHTALWPLAVYFGAVLVLMAAMLGLSFLLGPHHRERGTDQPYESGIKPTGSAWIHFDVKYYLIAMFFVIFDVESIFVFVWAVTVSDMGWAGFASMAIFIGVLLAALAYLWRAGALDWATFAKKTKGSLQI
jgi:NADH-quinone oxidoreductase subunit A